MLFFFYFKNACSASEQWWHFIDKFFSVVFFGKEFFSAEKSLGFFFEQSVWIPQKIEFLFPAWCTFFYKIMLRISLGDNHINKNFRELSVLYEVNTKFVSSFPSINIISFTFMHRAYFLLRSSFSFVRSNRGERQFRGDTRYVIHDTVNSFGRPTWLRQSRRA